ncbi:MAG TPA: DUF2568 domain-containing protein [Nocardioidaceae bacterium]|nr:DUF2568 domain-containing protein [Nocardioidaceae bacterium]
MIIFGWVVLGLVFVGEALTISAFADWGWHNGGDWKLLLAVTLAALTMIGWWMFASPQAKFGEGVLRDLLKVGMIGLATLALWDSGHETGAVVFVLFNAAVNLLAQIPSIKVLARP